jgi:hypothetical protein
MLANLVGSGLAVVKLTIRPSPRQAQLAEELVHRFLEGPRLRGRRRVQHLGLGRIGAFAPPLIHFIPYSLTYSVAFF